MGALPRFCAQILLQRSPLDGGLTSGNIVTATTRKTAARRGGFGGLAGDGRWVDRAAAGCEGGLKSSGSARGFFVGL
jgi:hypothetical protein